MLNVTEIYKSIQGESSFAGMPCSFVRLAGCPLRCRWCDTVYGFKDGEHLSLDQVIDKVRTLGLKVVEVTGGEPLAQEEAFSLLKALVDEGFQTLLETGGSISVERVPSQVHIIMDLKCPDSKMSEHNYLGNFAFLKPSDEIKFVVASREDFSWAREICDHYDLSARFNVLMSPAYGLVDPKDLSSWIIEAAPWARLNLQLHKYIWSPKAKGV